MKTQVVRDSAGHFPAFDGIVRAISRFAGEDQREALSFGKGQEHWAAVAQEAADIYHHVIWPAIKCRRHCGEGAGGL